MTELIAIKTEKENTYRLLKGDSVVGKIVDTKIFLAHCGVYFERDDICRLVKIFEQISTGNSDNFNFVFDF